MPHFPIEVCAAGGQVVPPAVGQRRWHSRGLLPAAFFHRLAHPKREVVDATHSSHLRYGRLTIHIHISMLVEITR